MYEYGLWVTFVGLRNMTVCAVGLEVVRPDLSRGCLETPFVAYLPSFSFVSPAEVLFLVSASVCLRVALLCSVFHFPLPQSTQFIL